MQNWFDWVENEELRNTLLSTVNGDPTTISVDDARAAVMALTAEGEVHIRRLVGDKFYEDNFPSNRVGPMWKKGRPTGWVDHYTAGISARGTVRWFSSQERETPGNSSAHYVVSRRGVIMTIVDPLTHVAWHAGTKENYTHIGVEHVNAGILSRSGSKVLYMDKHTYPLDRIPEIQELGDEIWEPYLSAQLVSNIALKRLLVCALPTLEREKFVDHEMIAPTRKKDCGPLWPLKNLNRLVFSWRGITALKSLEPTVMRKNVIALFNSEVDALLA